MKQEKKKEEKENKLSLTYNIQMTDNGIVISEPEYDVLECKEFSDKGDYKDSNMQACIGKFFWEDIVTAMDKFLCSNVRVSLTIEEDSE